MEDDLVERNELAQEEVWAKLVETANEERIFINGHPVTALLRHWQPSNTCLS